MPDYFIKYCEFSEVENDWGLLYKRSGTDNPFLSPTWNYQWATHYRKHWPSIVTVWQNNQLVALGWFTKDKNKFFFSDKFFADYSNILVDPNHKDAGCFLIEEIIKVKKCRMASFEPLRTIENETQTIAKTVSKRLHSQKILCSNPYIELDKSSSEFFAALPKKLRQDLRTSSNNLSKIAPWHFFDAQTIEDKKRVFDALIKFHLDRQNSKAGNSIFASDMNIRFFEDLILNNTSDYKIHLSAIMHDGIIVSATLGLSHKHKYFYWIPSFDKNLRKVSLGKLHISKLIEYCYLNGFTVFDFMGGDESYKSQWTNKRYDLIKIAIFNTKFSYFRHKLLINCIDFAKGKKNKSKFITKIWIMVSKVIQD